MKQSLTFQYLDDLAMAADKRGKNVTAYFSELDDFPIGPFVEWLLLSRMVATTLPSLASFGAVPVVAQLLDALGNSGRPVFVDGSNGSVGFIRITRDFEDVDNAGWAKFKMQMSTKAQIAFLAGAEARALVGALEEIENNVLQHSQRSHDAVVAFVAKPDEFSFVVGDNGIGPLSSFRSCSEYEYLADHGEALRLTLADGASRYGHSSGHGKGYNSLFIGLAMMQANLRFRTGNKMLSIRGVGPSRAADTITDRTFLQGFLASVVCRSPQGTLLQ